MVRSILLGVFLAFATLAVASGLYVFSVYKKIQSGEIAYEDLFTADAKDVSRAVEGSGRPFIGNEDAPAVFVEFVDFECPYCRESAEVIRQIMLEPYYQDKVRFVFRHFPVMELHPNALDAAMAAECAHEQNMFWEMHNAIFEIQDSLSVPELKKAGVKIGLDSVQFSECVDSYKYLDVIEDDFNDGIFFRIQSTPSFVVNGRIIEGTPTFSGMKSAIDAILMNK